MVTKHSILLFLFHPISTPISEYVCSAFLLNTHTIYFQNLSGAILEVYGRFVRKTVELRGFLKDYSV